MKDYEFGQIALQILLQSQIPGASLDVALQFRGIAHALAEGRLQLVKVPEQNGID